MKFVTTDGVSINYSIHGSGMPVLFVHGWSMSSQVFYHQRELDGIQSIMLDLRGHGLSDKNEDMDISYDRMAQDVIELIQSLNLSQKPFVASWSMGVSVVLDRAKDFDSIVSGFIFFGGTPKYMNSDDYKFGMKPIVARRLRSGVDESYKTAMMGFYQLIYFSEKVDKEEKKILNGIFRSILGTAPKSLVLKTLDQLYEGDYRNNLNAITKPSLIISGEIDKICLKTASEYMHSKIKGSKWINISGAGHMMYYTKYREVNEILRKFIIPDG